MTTWRNPELDEATAAALSIVTLYSTGKEADSAFAAELLDEYTSTPDATARIIGGLVSVSEALLVLREYETSAPPDASLQTVGNLVASALSSH